MSAPESTPATVEPIAQSLVQLQQQAQDMVNSVSQLSQETVSWLTHEARTRPLTSLGVAAACGFILGGGLPARLRGPLMALAGRFALNRLESLPTDLATVKLEKMQ